MTAYQPDPRHAELGADFMDEVDAATFPELRLRHRNQRWAERIGLGELDDARWLAHFGEFEPLPGNLPRPLALRYHGHQFQTYNPDLGDGRGFLFAQLRDDTGRLLDLGTKGSGETPWSRGGDGRLTLKGGVREVLATALLEALGVYTSKSLSLIETGEALERGDEPSPTRSSVLVRLSHSHIRIGSFQRQAYHDRADNLERLVDHVAALHAPEVADRQGAARATALLRFVATRSADLAASWMAAGFVHGVLNTDNLNVTGESFDYGPFRFLPTYDPAFTAAYFDRTGLYAYGHQPDVVQWNLARLAEALLPIGDREPLIEVLRTYPGHYWRALARHTRRRLGLAPREDASAEQAQAFATAVHQFLHESQVPFERFHFDWHGGLEADARARKSPEAARYEGPAFDAFRDALAGHEPAPRTEATDGYLAGGRPCTLLIDEIESLWSAIADRDDWAPFEAKLAEIERAREAFAPSSS